MMGEVANTSESGEKFYIASWLAKNWRGRAVLGPFRGFTGATSVSRCYSLVGIKLSGSAPCTVRHWVWSTPPNEITFPRKRAKFTGKLSCPTPFRSFPRHSEFTHYLSREHLWLNLLCRGRDALPIQSFPPAGVILHYTLAGNSLTRMLHNLT